MARKHRIEAAEDGGTILPLRLVAKEGLDGRAYAALWAERREWFRARGVDPGDWPAVYPVLKASWRAHGIPSAAERARLRLDIKESNHQ